MPVYKNEEKKTWFCSFYYTDWQGNRKKKKKEGFKTQKEAKEFEREFLEKLEGNCDMSFGAMCQLYLDDCKNKIKPTSLNAKKTVLEARVIPELGEIPVSEITANTLRIFNNKLIENNDYSNSYIKKINTQISCILAFAVKYYNLKSNPCKVFEGVKGRPTEEIQFWTLKEYKKFITAVDDIKYKVAYDILFWTGIRSGELLALTIGDINFKTKEISITKNYAKLNNQELILTPKTKKSKRVVEIPSFLADEIKEYIEQLYDKHKTAKLILVSRPSLRVRMANYAKKAKVKYIRLHDLRHSHASLLIEMGFQPLVVADRLGHENVKTTLEIYSHLYPNKQTTVCEKLEKLKF